MKTVCGLDVHKDSVFCCILSTDGQKIHHKFGVLTEELLTLRDLMESEGVGECAMESTSIYWIPVWRVLEKSVKLHLVNPYFIKQLPGRKSDVKDAEWIATCLQKELVSSSFVPEERIQRLRQYDRRIFDLSASISRNLVKLDQCVQRCNIRISNYVLTTDSKGYRSIVRLLSQGVTDAEVLVEELHGRTINRHGRETLIKALTGVVGETDMDIMSQLVEEIEMQQRHKDEAREKMTALCNEWFPEEMKNLQTIPGVKERSATSIIAETGTDKNSFFAGFAYRQCTERRKNRMKVQVAIARKLLVCVWYVLYGGTPYFKPSDHYLATVTEAGA